MDSVVGRYRWQVFACAGMNKHFHQASLPYGPNDSGCFANH